MRKRVIKLQTHVCYSFDVQVERIISAILFRAEIGHGVALIIIFPILNC